MFIGAESLCCCHLSGAKINKDRVLIVDRRLGRASEEGK